MKLSLEHHFPRVPRNICIYIYTANISSFPANVESLGIPSTLKLKREGKVGLHHFPHKKIRQVCASCSRVSATSSQMEKERERERVERWKEARKRECIRVEDGV